MENKRYLGDSVYAEYLGGGTYKLYLDNGVGEHNIIVLELEVMDAMPNFTSYIEENEE